MTTTLVSVADYADRLWGDLGLDGIVFVGEGSDPYLDKATGKVRHRHFRERSFAWPRERDRLVDHVLRSASTLDVWVTPGLSENATRKEDKRRPCPSLYLWADIDGADDNHLARARLLLAAGSFATASGRGDGHLHLYVRLAEPAPPKVVEHYNRRLVAFLAADPSPSALNGYLRPAGSLNHKPTLLTGGPPSHVAVLYDSAGSGWTLDELDELLPDVTPKAALAVGLMNAEPLPEPLPDTVAALIDEPVDGDRSNQTWQFVSVCRSAGMTLGQTFTAAGRHPPTVQRNRTASAIRSDVARCWDKQHQPDRPSGDVRDIPIGDAAARSDELGDSPTSSVDGPPDLATLLSNEGLHTVNLVRYVRDLGPIAMGDDGRLWAYRTGVWQPNGDTSVGRRVRYALQRKFRVAHLNTVLTWLRQDRPTISAEPIEPYINVRNGLINWRTGDLEDHRPDVPSTVQLPIAHDQTATCPAITAFLGDVVAPDAIDFIDELVGYAIYNGNPMHAAVLLLGGGRNGKGTFLRLIKALVGPQNTAAVPLHVLAENRFAAATLYGKVVNICGDLDARWVPRTDTFKMATGGDIVHAEHKYGQPFAFTPWATMLFSANQAPAAADTSEGYYSRWVVVPFPNTIPADRRIPEHILDQRLHQPAELSGLLNRALAGLRRLMDRGYFDPPESVTEATTRFRQDTDPVAGFLAECVVRDLDCWLPRKDMYERYKTWSDENGRKPLGSSKFYDSVRNGGYTDHVRTGTRGFLCGKSDGW